MNFSDFSKQKILKQEENKEFKEDIKKNYENLKNLDNDQLTKKLYEEVETQKKNGTFDYEMLNKNIDSISSFIPSETYQNLKRLIETLK